MGMSCYRFLLLRFVVKLDYEHVATAPGPENVLGEMEAIDLMVG